MTTTEAIPDRIPPMLASSARPFDDEGCVFELKWDGVRALTAITNDRIRIWGRDLQDYTLRYPELACLRNLPNGTVLDGELVLLRDGRADFHALMARHRSRPGRATEAVTYVVFDVLYHAGRSLLRLPYAERRTILHDTVPQNTVVTWCDGIVGAGWAFFEEAVAAGHEGVVAKRLSAHYRPGKRESAWRKIKQVIDLPCVVVGYRVVAGELRSLFMATVHDGKLCYVGEVELGIPSGRAFREQLEALRRPTCIVPCSDRARWIEPRLFCIVRCHGWRPSGGWRDPVVVRFGRPANRLSRIHTRSCAPISTT